MQIPTFPTPPYPEYSDAVLTQPANYGILEALIGTWVNVNPTGARTGLGLHTTCMPSPGTNTETIFGIFHFLCEDYVEELTFTPVQGGVRNRGGTNEQFVGAIEYRQSVQRASDGVGLHEEVGMYQWVDQIYNHAATEQSVIEDNGYPGISVGAGANGPNFVPPYPIMRSGTIPHGSTILLMGSFAQDVQGKPPFPTGTDSWTHPFVKSWPELQIANAPNLAASPLAISPSMGATALLTPPGSTTASPLNLDEPAPTWAFDKSLPVTDPDGNLTYFQRIVADPHYPYSVRPDLRLRDAIKDQNITKYTLIQLTSKHDGGAQGGVLNSAFVARFANATEMTLNMWLETVTEADGTEVLQLQYEQIIFFEFMFGTNGQTTRWPHIQVNTLRKQA